MKIEYSLRSLKKYSKIKFRENPSSGSRVVPCGRAGGRAGGRTDMTKLIVAFRNFPKALRATETGSSSSCSLVFESHISFTLSSPNLSRLNV